MRRSLRELLSSEGLSLPKERLYEVFLSCLFSLVKDPRDRVFGVLGLFDEETHVLFSDLGYRKSPQEIFRAATEAILTTSTPALEYLTLIHSVRRDNPNTQSPSSAWHLDYSGAEDIFQNNQIIMPENLGTNNKPRIEDGVLQAEALLFDEVVLAYPNFSSENFEKLVLDMVFKQLNGIDDATEWQEVFEKLSPIYFRLLEGSAGEFDPRQQYEGWVARVALREWEISREKDENADSWRGVPLSLLQQKCTLREKEYDVMIMSSMLRLDQDQKLMDEGRNIFVTAKGYSGLGVYGKNGAGYASAVQVHDKIVVFPGVEQPIVLRPCGDTEYRVIGPAFVPGIEKDESLEERIKDSMEQILIR